jgi:hypothetical protein
MDGSQEVCTPESLSQQPDGNAIRDQLGKQEDVPTSAATHDTQPTDDSSSHVAIATDVSEVYAPGFNTAADQNEPQQVEVLHTLLPSAQQLPDSPSTQVAPDGQNEPVRSEIKPSTKLDPTAALVYPWISASMRRSGTGTASFRTVSLL